MNRPSWDRYFMNIAQNVAERSNCIRRQVGAVIVKDLNIISTGYNGTPMGVRNCFDGGCPRCASDTPSGEGLDSCLCVHAEQNAVAFAARHGARTEGGALYTTLRPCFWCLKESIQAGLVKIVYVEPYEYEPELEEAYQGLVRESGLQMIQLTEDVT
jgi:dCMP deaminase